MMAPVEHNGDQSMPSTFKIAPLALALAAGLAALDASAQDQLVRIGVS
jgi:hypothetical protein